MEFVPTLKVEKPTAPDLSFLFKREEVQEKKVLNITLLATVSGSVSMALVNTDEGAKLVRIGSQIGDHRVSVIERNYIILSRGQEKKAVGFSFTSTTRPPEEAHALQGPTQTLQAVVQRKEIESITSDPGIMFRQIRLVPFVQNGRTTGFLFEWVDPQSMFSRVGIMQGDVLISINNQSIKSGEDAFRILQVLRNESSFKISLIREGKSIDLSVRVE
ncbi:PDZ domain-containing protein [Thermocrinis sp.]